MNIIIVGCGRVGVELALSLCRNHLVTVIDNNPLAFDHLGSDYLGRTVQGEGFDEQVLRQAGIQTADAVVAVTRSDNVNVVVGRMARTIYKIERVVARVYNPRRIPIYEKFGLQTVASSTWGAERLEQIILHPGLQSVFSAGNGEVQLYEISIPRSWHDRSIAELLPVEGARVMSLVRSGSAILPDSTSQLQDQDILHVSATQEAVSTLRQRLKTNGYANGHGKE
jgi:trk system potassium uptake protein TrkA